MSTTTTETKPCRVAGCDHEPFTGKYKNQAEATHYHRVHSRRVVVPNEKLRSKHKGKKRRVAESRFSMRNGHTKFKGLRLTNRDGSLDGRSKEARQQKAASGKHQEEVQFCPNCLTNLLAVASGLVKAGQTHMKINGCPKCGCNVRAVAEEIVAAKFKR